MAYSKYKKILFILFCLFIVLFPFFCVASFADTEITPTTIDGFAISSDNQIIEDNNSHYFYYNLQKNHTYIMNNIDYDYGLSFYYSDSLTVGSNVQLAFTTEVIPSGSSITFTANDDYLLSFYRNYNNSSSFSLVDVTDGMGTTVASLVDNVGIDSIWNIFDISINYIVVVILFAFGCYIIFKVIKKISKGKEGL